MAETAKKVGVVDTAGAWTYWTAPDGEQYKFNGWSKFAQALADEREWAAVLKKQVLRKAGIRVRYR